MATLEQITTGSTAMTTTYRLSNGNVAERLLFREDEESISLEENSLP